jgi:hypothetical protein
MNPRSETAERAVPPGNRKGVGPEAYLNSTSQGEPVLPVPSVVAGSEAEGTPEDGRTGISAVAVTPGRDFVKFRG